MNLLAQPTNPTQSNPHFRLFTTSPVHHKKTFSVLSPQQTGREGEE